MINSKGADMSILFGFTKYILELIEKEKPTHLAVAFDPPGRTFRNGMYTEYKANRDATPQLVIDALEPLTGLCQAMNIPVLMMPGFEADDVIGSMARRAEKEGFKVFMVTPDKDYGQLISPSVFQYRPGKSGSESEVIDSEKVCSRYGISTPEQVIEILTICGDASDNVPGVKGIGEVGAGKLIARYGTEENIYAHISELTARQQDAFRNTRGYIGLSHELVTIKTDIELDIGSEAMILDNSFNPVLADLFEKYEFNSLRKFFSDAPVAARQESEKISFTEVEPDTAVGIIRKCGGFAIITSAPGTGIFGQVSRITVACKAFEGDRRLPPLS